ncbi:MAG: sensor histidine kinase [Bacteroidia bacterium]|nr:sensor histidine kinase [Bacteroidia bacterium]
MAASFISSFIKTVVKFKLYHILFWIIYIFSWSLILSSGGTVFRDFENSAYVISFHIAVCYFNNYFLISWFLLKRKYGPYILSLLLSITLVCFPLAIVYYSFIPLGFDSINSIWTASFFLINALYILFTVSITASIKLFRNYYVKEQANLNLEKLNIQSELNFLKSQINPHFLFNSLNNLYALTLKKSELAPEVVLKLSNILRFGLYDSSLPQVPLETDIRNIRDYLELESLRLGKRTEILFDVIGNTSGKQIEPLLFINFIENAFKHGAGACIGESFIRLILNVETPGELYFSIINSKPQRQEKRIDDRPGGIGLKNSEKRLNILYPGKHNLNIADELNTYTVTLTIKLS